MIREALPRDLPQFLELVHRFRAQLETYPNCPVDHQSVVHVFGRCLSSAMCLALVAEHDGQLTGALLAITQELWWSARREATDCMVYSEHPGDGFRMAKRYIEWAWTIPKVEVVTLAHSSGVGIEQADRLHELLGMRRIGSISQIDKAAMKQGSEFARLSVPEGGVSSAA